LGVRIDAVEDPIGLRSDDHLADEIGEWLQQLGIESERPQRRCRG